MLWDKPRVSGGFATGPGTTAGDLFDATFQSGLYADNLDARDRAVGEAYDDRNDAIFKATGVRLDNPWRQLDVGSAEFGEDQPDFFGEWQQRANDLANNRPEFRDIIRPDRSPLDDARDKQRSVLATARDTVERYDGALPAWMVQLGGGLKASAFDKVNLATLFVGPTGRVGTSAAAVAWNGIKAGAANAAVEATFQPSVAAWRKEAGLDLTASEIALNVGSAFGLGFGLDAGVRSAYRGVQRFSGRAPVLDGDGKVAGWSPAETALENAARAAPSESDLAKAAAGDPAALRKLADETGAIEDPAVRGALDELDNALPEAEALREAGDIDRLLQALRHADDPNAHAPPTRGDATPDARGISMADDAPDPPGRRFDMEGKPVTFADVDPLKVETDAAVFQFKAGGDAAGATERLRGVETWDPIAAGRAVIYQRRDGTMIIADGHQRLTLARRLADQKPQLQAFVFREADGWTPGDVRALAAKKNLQEGSGTVVDAAAIIRERPDIIDKSVPLGSEAMRQARSLARLSDEAFDMVVGGVIQPNYAALLGDLVPDKGRHAGMLDELVAADPANVREARFVINELIYAPVQVEEQLTLLGSWRVERSLMKERVGVLDKALNALKSDQRLFRTLDREAGRIEAAGNTLDKDLNARRAAEAAELAAVIEQLAATRGPVGEWLNDAARAVSAGMPKSRAADAFARRVADTLERDGLRGLMQDPEILRGAGIDDPGGPDAVAQVASLERSLGREIEIARAPEKERETEQVLFSLGRELTGHSAPDRIGYFSGALRAAHALRQVKGTPEQMLAMLQKEGAKKAEIEATGLARLFEGKSSITKQEIISFLEENRIGVREVKRTRQPTPEGIDSWTNPTPANDAKWQAYSLDPSNPTYSETVLHLPGGKPVAHLSKAERDELSVGHFERPYDRLTGDQRLELQAVYGDSRADTFQSIHFPDPNIVGHMMTSLTKHEGKTVFTLDQIQSDWGQKLRDGGVRDEAKIARVKSDIEHLRKEATKLEDRARFDGSKIDQSKLERFQRTDWFREDSDSLGMVIEDWFNADASVVTKPMLDFADAMRSIRLKDAELRTAEAATPGHPLVNTTDQWVNTTLRRAIRQAAEADAEYIAVPSGDTVLSYNPGDADGMRGFYGATKMVDREALQEAEDIVDLTNADYRKAIEDQSQVQRRNAEQTTPNSAKELRAAREAVQVAEDAWTAARKDLERLRKMSDRLIDGIVPKNLKNLLRKIDKQSPDAVSIDKLETPTSGMKGEGFTLFKLTDKVKARVLSEGQPLFSMRETRPIAQTPRALEQWEEIGRALRDTLPMLPPDVRIRVEDKIIIRGGGDDAARYAVQGYWSPTDRLVWVALSEGDPVRTARHEVVHALRSSGLLSDQEFNTMYQFAQRLGLREAYQIDKKYRQPYGKAYGHLGDAHVEALLREEVIADMFADYSVNGRRFGQHDGGSTVDKIIDAIVQFLARLRNSLNGLGFRDVRDVFEAIETGAVANRKVYAAARRSDGTLFMFGGTRARTADLDALKAAREMHDAGKPREEIWRKTGWFRGVDGKWRFEISDNSSRIGGGGDRRLASFLRHVKLFDAYGEDMADISVRRTRKGSGGSYSPGFDEIEVARGPGTKSIALHEAQHAVQEREGFSEGGDPAEGGIRPPVTGVQARRMYQAQLLVRDAAHFNRTVDEYVAMRRSWEADKSAPYPFTDLEGRKIDDKAIELAKNKAELDALVERARLSRGHEVYRRLAGEVEARTVQKRMRLNDEQRRDRPPWLDYDVPEDKQIVRHSGVDLRAALDDVDRIGDLKDLAEACKL